MTDSWDLIHCSGYRARLQIKDVHYWKQCFALHGELNVIDSAHHSHSNDPSSLILGQKGVVFPSVPLQGSRFPPP